MSGERSWRLLRAARPFAAATVFLLVVVVSLVSAAFGTFGFDFLSYDLAVRRFLDGGVLYDPAFQTAGPFGLFYYPPPFAVLMLPLAVLPPAAAAVAFSILGLGAFVLAIAILPVPRDIRWVVLLVGSLSWPLVYAVKLGQVGPILLLTFAIGWRWMERPVALGLATALGIAIKVQPVVVLAWALATRRRRAILVALGSFAVLAVITTLVLGPDVWIDQGELLIRMSRPIDTPRNLTLGRLAFEAGAGYQGAWAVQVLHWGLLAAVVAIAVLRGSPTGSYLAVVVASQLVSPIFWDHYAVMLLLPVAWLVSRGHWWTLLLPLATSVPLVLVTPAVAYPLTMWIGLLTTVRESLRDRRELDQRAAADA